MTWFTFGLSLLTLLYSPNRLWKGELPMWRTHHCLTAVRPATGALGFEFGGFYGANTGFSRLRVLQY